MTWSGIQGAQAGSTFPQAARVSSPQAVSTLPRQLVLVPLKQVALLLKQLWQTLPGKAALVLSHE